MIKEFMTNVAYTSAAIIIASVAAMAFTLAVSVVSITISLAMKRVFDIFKGGQ